LFDRYLPTPSHSAIELGAITLHYYALCILLGIICALAIGRVRWKKSGGIASELYDLAIYVIPAGIIGGRLYHVITTPELYFGKSGKLSNAFKIWEGGMGIWGAVALGALVAYIYFQARPRSLTFTQAIDALAPGILIAQSIGRWGNWFNHELFGRPSTLPWALKIPLIDRPMGFEGYSTFQPTFLYESLWCLLCALVILYLPQVRKLASGSTFLLYIFLYCLGRIWIESLRIDAAHHIFGVRLNFWVSLLCALTSLLLLVKRQGAGAKKVSRLDTLST
jgi:prolipoprotein diacylglyceryl transferase